MSVVMPKAWLGMYTEHSTQLHKSRYVSQQNVWLFSFIRYNGLLHVHFVGSLFNGGATCRVLFIVDKYREGTIIS